MADRVITDNFGKVKLDWIQLRALLLAKFERYANLVDSDTSEPVDDPFNSRAASDIEDDVFETPDPPQSSTEIGVPSYGKLNRLAQLWSSYS